MAVAHPESLYCLNKASGNFDGGTSKEWHVRRWLWRLRAVKALPDESRLSPRAIRGLAALAALPAEWLGGAPVRAGERVAELLVAALGLEFAYLRLQTGQSAGQSIEMARTVHQPDTEVQTREIGKALAPWLDGSDSGEVRSLANPLGNGMLRVLVISFGRAEQEGVLVAASQQADFPAELDRLFLRAVAKQITTLLQYRRAEEKLRSKDSLLAEAQSLDHIGSWNWDIVSDTVLWSDEHYRIFGVTPQEMVMTYEGILSHIHPDDRQTVVDKVLQALEDRNTYECCLRALRPDGTVRYVQSRGRAVFDTGGKPVRMFGTAQDITERVQAEEALRGSAERLQVLSRRVVEVQEEERRHIARELHDEIGQSLSAISLNLHAVKRACHAAAWPRIDEGIQIINRAIQQVRNLSLDLRPSMLEHLGLVATLRWYADRYAQRAGLSVHFAVKSSAARLPVGLTVACFRVAQEALTNVVRHAQARHVWVELNHGEDEVDMAIRDDGIGFDPETVRHRAGRGESFGLLGIHERADLLGGRADIRSKPGQGTNIRVWFPTASPQMAPGPGQESRR